MLLREATERYLDAHPNVRAEKTRRNHRQNVDRLAEWLGREPELADLDDETLGRFWGARLKQRSRRGGTISPSTVNAEATGALAVLKWASRKHWCEWPDARPPQRIRKAPRALTLQQLESLFRAASLLKGTSQGIPSRDRWLAFIALSIDTGARIDAVRKMEWRDIDGDVWHSRAETRKGQCSEQRYQLSPPVVALLATLQSHGEPTPFGWLGVTSIYAKWSSLREIADLPEWVLPHTLRKTAASHCDTIEDARELLGHSSVSTTLQNYWDRTVRPKPTSKLHDALAKVSPPPPKWAFWRTA